MQSAMYVKKNTPTIVISKKFILDSANSFKVYAISLITISSAKNKLITIIIVN